jgi:hypothetical protein
MLYCFRVSHGGAKAHLNNYIPEVNSAEMRNLNAEHTNHPEKKFLCIILDFIYNYVRSQKYYRS